MSDAAMRTSAALVIIDSLAWVGISVLWGMLAGLLPARAIDHDTWWTRPKRWERDGKIYRKVAVQRWKDVLPESNTLGPGERQSKSNLPPRAGIGDFIAETRRAEYVHLAVAASGPLFALWNPPWLAVVMIIAGIGFNLPFIVIQRYNRFRLLRVKARLDRS